jgi:hypothetical protein
MKKVTKNNLIKLVEMKKRYIEKPNPELLKEINSFIENGINKDKRYYSKLSSYGFDSETIKYLM